MESNDREFGSHQEDVYIGRLALFLVAFAIVAMAVAVVGWVKFKSKNEPPLGRVMLFTVIATGPVVGMYLPTFTTFCSLGECRAVGSVSHCGRLGIPARVERLRDCASGIK